MKLKVIVVSCVLLIALVAGAGFFFLKISEEGSLSLESNSEGDGAGENVDMGNVQDSRIPFIPEKIESDSVSGGGGSGGGGGSEGALSTGLSGCVPEQISYALKNSGKSEECLVDSGGVCISKRVGCFVDVHNLDYSVSGIFEINSDLSDDLGNRIDRKTISKSVGPREQIKFENYFELSGEDASKVLACSSTTSIVPKKSC